MKYLDFINKINWRLIAIHLIGTFFIVLAARQFIFLNDMGIIKSFDKYGYPDAFKHLVKEENFMVRFSHFTLWNNLAPIIGILIAFIISLFLTIKKKIFWLNAVIVFAIALLLNKLGLFENSTLDDLFFPIGKMAIRFGLQFKFITNGTVYALVGILFFFSKQTNRLAYGQTNNTDNNSEEE